MTTEFSLSLTWTQWDLKQVFTPQELANATNKEGLTYKSQWLNIYQHNINNTLPGILPQLCAFPILLHRTIHSAYYSAYSVTVYNADQIAGHCVRFPWSCYPLKSLGISSIPICFAFPSSLRPGQVASLPSVAWTTGWASFCPRIFVLPLLHSETRSVLYVASTKPLTLPQSISLIIFTATALLFLTPHRPLSLCSL